jgi:hypothetical protein
MYVQRYIVADSSTSFVIEKQQYVPFYCCWHIYSYQQHKYCVDVETRQFLSCWATKCFVLLLIKVLNTMSMCLHYCLRYPACKSHILRAVLYILSSVGCLALPNLSSHKRHDLPEKRNTAIKCVFWFPLQLMPKVLPILRIVKRDVINLHRYSHKVTVTLVRFYSNFQISKNF